MNTSHVFRNMFLQSLLRGHEVAPVLVQLLPGEWEEDGCCGFWFFLTLLFGLSTSVSEVSVYVACCSVAEVGYWIRHIWKHWLLGQVGRLE